MYYVIQIDHSDPNYGHFVGPFCSADHAREWADENIRSGVWEVAPLNAGVPV